MTMIIKLQSELQKIVSSTIPLMLSVLMVSSILFVQHYYKLKNEHTIMLKSLEGFGGASEIPKDFDNEDYDTDIIDWWIETHGLNLYFNSSGWSFDFIEQPMADLENSYVRYEKGWRWFNAKQCRNLKIRDTSNDGEWDYHNAIDLISKYNLQVKASITGKSYIGYGIKAGNYIVIWNREYWTNEKIIKYGLRPYRNTEGRKITTKIKYFHMSFIEIDNKTEVKQGQIIGRYGDSGRAVGAHLDFSIWIDGRNRNPFCISTFKKRVVI